MQKVKLVARTFEIDTVAEISGIDSIDIEDNTTNEMELLSGKAAGVCYMPDDYFENGIQNEEKALKRVEMTSKSGHHSVFDHGHLTFVIKTNKMLAMILNSLGVYATSEKSARYTKMQPETELELQLYNKWKSKIQELILAKYPDTDDAVLRKAWLKKYPDGAGYIVKNGKLFDLEGKIPPIEDKEANTWFREKKKSMEDTLPSMKLAMENARYMISIFTPTTMMYTVSFRQACLIMNYLYELSVNLENATDEFSKKLKPYVIELWKEFENSLNKVKIMDNKNQYIRFLEAQHVGELSYSSNKAGREFTPYTDLDSRLKSKNEQIADSYTLVYNGSLAMLAQAQRHRTLRYTMKLQESGEYGYYTPEIVIEAGLENEWQEDIKRLKDYFPQGTIVRITEQGLFEDFALKCKERLCGRAQLETMKSTIKQLNKFIDNSENLSYSNNKLLKTMLTEDVQICARCKFKDFRCTEGCGWGHDKALNRLI